MKETILLYNFSRARLKATRRALSPICANIRTVAKKDYFQPIGYLCGIDGILPSENNNSAESFDEEMLLMCGFGSEKIDVLIAALKACSVGRIDLKAVVTPSNVYWDSVSLYKAVKADHDAMKNS